MKKNLLLTVLLFSTALFSQVGINTTTPDPSSMLDITATDKGMLIPRMTEAQRDAITTPAESLIIYNIDTGCINTFSIGKWISMCDIQTNFDITLPNGPCASPQWDYFTPFPYINRLSKFTIEINGRIFVGATSGTKTLYELVNGAWEVRAAFSW